MVGVFIGWYSSGDMCVAALACRISFGGRDLENIAEFVETAVSFGSGIAIERLPRRDTKNLRRKRK